MQPVHVSARSNNKNIKRPPRLARDGIAIFFTVELPPSPEDLSRLLKCKRRCGNSCEQTSPTDGST